MSIDYEIKSSSILSFASDTLANLFLSLPFRLSSAIYPAIKSPKEIQPIVQLPCHGKAPTEDPSCYSITTTVLRRSYQPCPRYAPSY